VHCHQPLQGHCRVVNLPELQQLLASVNLLCLTPTHLPVLLCPALKFCRATAAWWTCLSCSSCWLQPTRCACPTQLICLRCSALSRCYVSQGHCHAVDLPELQQLPTQMYIFIKCLLLDPPAIQVCHSCVVALPSTGHQPAILSCFAGPLPCG
jgi:hypothetical protein